MDRPVVSGPVSGPLVPLAITERAKTLAFTFASSWSARFCWDKCRLVTHHSRGKGVLSGEHPKRLSVKNGCADKLAILTLQTGVGLAMGVECRPPIEHLLACRRGAAQTPFPVLNRRRLQCSHLRSQRCMSNRPCGAFIQNSNPHEMICGA